MDGVAEGEGVESSSEGRFSGMFRSGLRDGPGELKGDVSYIGYWRKGKKDRFGVETLSSGDIYEGEFYQGKK